MRPSDFGSVPGFQSFLRKNSLRFACAESCTGGLLARQLTALAGSSDVFWGGVVSYANEAKTVLLGVDSGLLAAHGAVSGPVAEAMVQGVLRQSGVGLAASVTGVAGPGGGSPEKPVGTVWVGLGAIGNSRTGTVSVRLALTGRRNEIQRQAARWARVLAAVWWASGMELDSLRALTDNEGKSAVADFRPPTFFHPHSFNFDTP